MRRTGSSVESRRVAATRSGVQRLIVDACVSVKVGPIVKR
jgi:hypothetical protein